MAEKKIKTVSFVHIGDKLVSTDELNAEQKSQGRHLAQDHISE